MNEYLFLKPGDVIFSRSENSSFHRDEKYTISQCFATKRGLEIYVQDKRGYDVPLKVCDYELSGKTYDAVVERKNEALIELIWQTQATPEIFLGWEDIPCSTGELVNSHNSRCRKSVEFIITNRCIFGSYPKAVASIAAVTYSKLGRVVTNTSYFEDIAEAREYLTQQIPTDMHHSLKIKDVPGDLHNKIVHMMFLELSSFPCESSIEYSEMKHYVDVPDRYERQDFSDMSFLDFKKYIANLIFDKESTVGKPSAILNDVLILYRDLPSSHSATSVSKILLGKSKVKIQKLEPFFGKYTKDDIRQPQLFELASRVESYLYRNKIFSTKEDYCSGTEFRGQFEYIGSKYIDNVKLNEMIF